MLAIDLLAFVRANLPRPPARLLEVGAGDGELARALAGAGYEVVAIDPHPSGPDVRAVSLLELDEPERSFDAALAVTSLHHVEPLEPSLDRLADILRPGALLAIDEFDVAAFDERAAQWWLDRRREPGANAQPAAAQIVAEHRAHLHPVERIVAALEPGFQVGLPLYGPYLHRWDLGDAFRDGEQAAIASGAIPAVGARLLARRRA